MIMHPQSKLYWHSEVSKWLRGNCPPPVLIEIAPTGFCNASCPWCFFKDRHEGVSINADVMRAALFDMGRMGVKSINWTGGGEPTLHIKFDEFVELTNNLGIAQGLFTNGYEEIPTADMFDWIRISVTSSGLNKVVFPKVKFGVCLNQTADMTLGFMRSVCIRARGNGASYFQVRPALMGYYLLQPRIIIPRELEEYTTDEFEVIFTQYKYQEAQKPHGYGDCYGYNFVPSIDWRGRVATCLYRSDDPEYVLGDLNMGTFKDIWASKPDKVSVDKRCQNCCKNHEINKALYAAKRMEQVDFL